MKKLIAFCLLIVSVLTVQSQTKEETISWIKEKLEKNLIGTFQSKGGYVHLINLKLNEITSCNIITISYTTTGRGAFGTHHYNYILPTEGIRFQNNGTFYYSSEKITVTRIGEERIYYTSDT